MTPHLIKAPERSRACVTLASVDEIVSSTQDFLDLIAWGGEHNTNLVLLTEASLPKEFYDLSTRIAGEILQKVSNYHVRLAIVGTFDIVSERFREMMRESNRGRHVYFARTNDEAMDWLYG